MPPQALADAHALVVTVAEIDGVLRREGHAARPLVLEAYGITVEEYLDAKTTLKARIAEEAADGSSASVMTYSAAFERARDAEQFTLDPTYAPRARRDEALPATPPPADAPPEKLALPTYLNREPHLVPAAIAAPAPSPAGRRSPLGATGELDPRKVASAALPFLQAARSNEPGEEWTVQQYASLCAEVAARGALTPARIAAYGLRDAASLQAVHRTWQKRLEARPELREEWSRLSAEYRAWLASQPK